MKITNTSKVEEHKFNLAVLGPSKSGKTNLAATVKGKVLICNTDKGSLTLAGCSIDCVNVSTFPEFVEFMKFVTKSKQFVDKKYEWVIFDSATVLADMLKKHLEESGVTGFDMWNEYLKVMRGLCAETRDTNRFHSITIYEVAEKENSNGLLEKKFGVEGSLRDRIPYFYDFVFATKKVEKKDKSTQYLLQTVNRDGYNFLGGRGQGKLNDFEPSNINHIIKKLKGVK